MNDKPDRMPNVPPFVKFVASAVPMVFDNSLSYYEALCALWKYIQGMTDVINNNATLEEEYIEKFNELKTFVDTYFDNLDVQDEINHKLDEMVESGVLQRILNSPATRDSLGGVIVGDGLDITTDGTLSTKPYNFVVSKVNGSMNNSMFPDVAKFGDKYYMVFRSGTLHASFDGKISFCYSEDGVNWSTPEDILVETDVDYRDPFLSVINGNLYLSTFTRVDNGDDTVTLTSYVYQLNPVTLGTTLVKTIANEAIFGKIVKANDLVVFGTYDNDASHIYRGNTISDATIIHSFAIGYELTIRFFDNEYYMLMRKDDGVHLMQSTNLTNWTEMSIPQMTSADSLTKIGDKYLIGYRDSIITNLS